uniref:Uncharacterized protein n=1 Tax=Rhizophora mucronata TaxID=61149 RepID=A0A2P2NWT4_RHIMU
MSKNMPYWDQINDVDVREITTTRILLIVENFEISPG